jgi:hypothetical protein
MLQRQHDSQEPQPHRRSRLLIAAYLTLGGALASAILGPSLYATGGMASMAVLLAIAEAVVQVRRRSTPV